MHVMKLRKKKKGDDYQLIQKNKTYYIACINKVNLI